MYICIRIDTGSRISDARVLSFARRANGEKCGKGGKKTTGKGVKKITAVESKPKPTAARPRE